MTIGTCIPAQAGIQGVAKQRLCAALDPGLRRGTGCGPKSPERRTYHTRACADVREGGRGEARGVGTAFILYGTELSCRTADFCGLAFPALAVRVGRLGRFTKVVRATACVKGRTIRKTTSSFPQLNSRFVLAARESSRHSGENRPRGANLG